MVVSKILLNKVLWTSIKKRYCTLGELTESDNFYTQTGQNKKKINEKIKKKYNE